MYFFNDILGDIWDLITEHIIISIIIIAFLFLTGDLGGILALIIIFLGLCGLIQWFFRRSDRKEKQNIQDERARKEAEEEQKQLQERKRIQSLLPTEACHYTPISISNEDSQYLGGGDIRYMSVIDASHLITFPESDYGNNRGYYLLNIDFKPNQLTKTDYLSSNDINSYMDFNTAQDGNLNGYGITNGNATSYKDEIPSTALLTLTPEDLSGTIRVKLYNATSRRINFIKQYFLLGQIEKQRLGLIR